jgi:two-component system chemotaxis response regulator CheB
VDAGFLMNAFTGMGVRPKIRVLIVDDSAIVRKILTETIDAEPDMEVVGTAPDPYVARDKILALKPDVLTLDIEMPRMNGLQFLTKLMQFHPMPVIIISSLAQSSCEISLEAMRLGAVDVLAKPGGPYSIGELRETLPAKLRVAASARLRPKAATAAQLRDADVAAGLIPATSSLVAPPVGSANAVIPQEPPFGRMQASALQASGNVAKEPLVLSPAGMRFHPEMLLAIGASTGGTEAIHDVLVRLPRETPGIVITQHIPKSFSGPFAQRLNRDCAIEVREACDGDEIRRGLALVAPGDQHMVIRRSGGRYLVQLQNGPKVCYQRPAVDVMFASVAAAATRFAVGVLLTGMGTDGAQGLLLMRKAGAMTLAQDEATCVVFGMPREAFRMGAVERLLPLPSISAALIQGAARRL